MGLIMKPENKILLIVLLACTTLGCSIIPHPRPWTKREKIALYYFAAGHIGDTFTTYEHQKSPHRYYETNPILGRHPSDRRIGLYFSITGLVTILLCDWYPELRKPLLIGYGTVGAYSAVNNINMMNK